MLNGLTTITIEWALVVLSLIFVVLRLYVRLTAPSNVRLQLCDAIVVCAWLSLATLVTLGTVLSKWGLLAHGSLQGGPVKKSPRPEDKVQALKIIYGSAFPYILSIYLVKATILMWYYKITPTALKHCRIALGIISTVCIIGFIASMAFNFLSCWPVSRNWALDESHGCVAGAQYSTFFVSFACHLLTDFLIFVYPLPLLRSIHMAHHRRRTWGIIVLFTLGFLAVASALARVIAVAIRSTAAAVAVWTSVECSIGIIIACCPALRILIQSSKPAVRIHTKKHTLKNHLGSAESYVSGHTTRTTLVTSDIWDGTDSTAPEWIRLGSRGVFNGSAAGKDIEIGGFIGENDGIRTSIGGGGYIYTPPRTYPGFILQPGRGIIQHAPGITPPRGTPCWMSLPDPPFLCETEEPEPVPITNPAKLKVRWCPEASEEDPARGRGRGWGKREDDGNVQESREPWDTGSGGRLERIVETLSEPAAVTKRWSQGSFGDRNNHKRLKGEDRHAVIVNERLLRG